MVRVAKEGRCYLSAHPSRTVNGASRWGDGPSARGGLERGQSGERLGCACLCGGRTDKRGAAFGEALLPNAKTFTNHYWAESYRRGVEKAKRIVCINDGAIWNDGLRARRIDLDWWHMLSTSVQSRRLPIGSLRLG